MHFHPDELIKGMRKELTDLGVGELKTSEEVEETLSQTGTVLVVVNSVCGCAAGNARPAIKIAMNHNKLPNKVVTVFAGQDKEATAKAREFFTDIEPSSPSFTLLKDSKPVFNIPRLRIEGRTADDIAKDLVNGFDTYC